MKVHIFKRIGFTVLQACLLVLVCFVAVRIVIEHREVSEVSAMTLQELAVMTAVPYTQLVAAIAVGLLLGLVVMSSYAVQMRLRLYKHRRIIYRLHAEAEKHREFVQDASVAMDAYREQATAEEPAVEFD